MAVAVGRDQAGLQLCVCVCASSDLLDAGLHVDHRARDATGSHAGLEMDDPAVRHSKHHPRLSLQGGASSHLPPCSPVCCVTSFYLFNLPTPSFPLANFYSHKLPRVQCSPDFSYRLFLLLFLTSPTTSDLSQFIPESARYNVSAGKVEVAMETLQRIANMNRSFLPAGRLVEPPAVSHHFIFVLVCGLAASTALRVCVSEGARQLEVPAELVIQEDVPSALVLMVAL